MDILNAGSDKISLMLLDLLMPVMDGYELVRSLRKKSVMRPC